MADSSNSTQMVPVYPQYQQGGSQSPTINLTEANKEGIIKVMFQVDERLLGWVLNNFFDSHLERIDGGEPISVPNSNFYECPECKQLKRKDNNFIKAYMTCSGTKENPHLTTYTYAKDWKPKLSRTGISFLLGQIEAAVNANIGTANFGKSEGDVKRNAQLEDRLLESAFFTSYTMPAIIISEYKDYVADWVIEEKKLAVVFSEPFIANFIVLMTYNILANLGKGKGMEAIRGVLENRVSTQQESRTFVDYPQMGGSGQNSANRNRLLDIFNFNRGN